MFQKYSQSIPLSNKKNWNKVVVPGELATTLIFPMVAPIGLATAYGVISLIDVSLYLFKGDANSSGVNVYCDFLLV